MDTVAWIRSIKKTVHKSSVNKNISDNKKHLRLEERDYPEMSSQEKQTLHPEAIFAAREQNSDSCLHFFFQRMTNLYSIIYYTFIILLFISYFGVFTGSKNKLIFSSVQFTLLSRMGTVTCSKVKTQYTHSRHGHTNTNTTTQ